MDDVTTGIQEAGAVPVATTAEASGQVPTTTTDNTTGAVPGTATAEPQGGQEGEITTQEGETATEGSTATTDKGTHQKTLEERVQELAEKRITEVETKLNAKLEAVTRAKAEEKPNFYEIDLDKVNNHIGGAIDKIEALKLEGRFLEAIDLQDDLTQLRQELRGNEQRKSEWMQRSQAQTQNAQMDAQIAQHLDQAADLVAKELNVPPDVWQAAAEFFVKERSEKPLINAQFREKVLVQGPVAAILWAKDYIEQNMGKPQQELINKKEAAKTTLPPGKTSTGEVVDNANLASLRAKAVASGNTEDLAAYMAEKSKAAATR